MVANMEPGAEEAVQEQHRREVACGPGGAGTATTEVGRKGLESSSPHRYISGGDGSSSRCRSRRASSRRTRLGDGMVSGIVPEANQASQDSIDDRSARMTVIVNRSTVAQRPGRHFDALRCGPPSSQIIEITTPS